MKMQNSKGQATLEFIAILPAMFLMFFSVLEFSTMLIQDQRVAALSREITNAVYRDCMEVEENEIPDCIGGIATRVFNGAGTILPDFSNKGNVMVAVYAPDPDDPSDNPAVVNLGSDVLGGGGYSSYYSENNLDQSFVADQGFIAIGEAFYTYEPMTALRDILNLIGFPDQLYEATIY